jgi:uncharacterized protein (DUF58 family)
VKASSSNSRHGAWVDLDELVAAHRNAAQLDIQHNALARSAAGGQFRTRQRGRGLEFEEVRQYQAGDELRALDWRVTARTGIAHTKLFREEREKPSVVVVDQRQSMAFGSRVCFKSVLAARLAALISWAALQTNDRVGGFVFSDHLQHDIRPAKKRSTVLQLLQQIAFFNRQLIDLPQQGDALNKANPQQVDRIATELARIARPGSRVFFISDFIGLSEQGLQQLYLLKRHCEVYAIHLYDAMEKKLPAAGYRQFTNGLQNSGFDTTSSQLQQRFEQRFTQRCQQLKRNCLSHGIAYLNVATHQNPLDALTQQFATQRQGRVKKPVSVSQ